MLTRRTLMGAVLAMPYVVTTRAQNTEVAISLQCAIDASGSVTPARYRRQILGYRDAFLSEKILASIPKDGLAVLAYEWDTVQRIRAPWTIIRTKDEMRAFAHRHFEDVTRSRRTEGATLIGAALGFAYDQFVRLNGVAQREILDVSGDGAESLSQQWLTEKRELLLQRGVTINGLPILADTDPPQPPEGLDVYYRENVIGGPGAFVEPAHGFEDFARALEWKLGRELLS